VTTDPSQYLPVALAAAGSPAKGTGSAEVKPLALAAAARMAP
jgi:hypothetical protein